MAFTRATKHEAKLRMALIGPAGSGKTYTALSIASHLGDPVALLDTEHGSASKYADLFDFDTDELTDHHPERFISAIKEAEKGGYDVLVIDSLSHAWMGRGGALEIVDNASKGGGNNFAAWRNVTPLHNRLIDAMLGARLHILVTLRSKVEYVQERDERGRTSIRKVGMRPIQRDGIEFEFDVAADLDQDNTLIIGKTRCPLLRGRTYPQAGEDVALILKDWLKGVALPTMNEVYAFGLEHGLAPDDVKQLLHDVGFKGFKPAYVPLMRQAIIDAMAQRVGEEEPRV